MSQSNSCFSPSAPETQSSESGDTCVSSFSPRVGPLSPDLQTGESSGHKWSYYELHQVALRIKFDGVCEEFCPVSGGLW